MKNIKFRFVNKHKETGEIWFVYTSVDELESEDSWQGRVNYKRIAQNLFTGLLDKNNHEIYEGDICRNGDYEVDSHCYNYRIEEIVYNTDGASFSGWNYCQDGMTCEIIGNTYENQELMEN